MLIRCLSVLFSAALFFSVTGCSSRATDDVDVVTEGVHDDLAAPAVDGTTAADLKTIDQNNDDPNRIDQNNADPNRIDQNNADPNKTDQNNDLDVVVEKDVK